MGPRIASRWDLFAACLGLWTSLWYAGSAHGQAAEPMANVATTGPPAAAVSDPRATERFRAAAALQNRELFDLAAAEWTTFLERFAADPLAVRARFQRGVCFFQLAKYDEAEGEFQQLLANQGALDPELAEQCYAHLGLAQYNLGTTTDGEKSRESLDAAIATLDRQLQLFPKGPLAPQAAFYHADAQYARGEFAAAIGSYRALLDQYPQHPQRAEALYALGVAEQEHGQLEEAAHTMDQFLTEFGQHELAADARLRRGEIEEALLLRAKLDHEHGDFAGGIKDADACLAVGPTAPHRSDALHIRGLCEMGLHNPAKAAETLSQIVEQDPKYGSLDRVLYDLAWAYEESRDGNRAIAAYAKLAESFPESPLAAESLYRAGEAQYASGDFGAAGESFRAAITLATDAALRERAAHKLAWADFERQEFDAAEASFRQQLAEHPDGPLAADARVMVAECQFQQRKFGEALDSFAAALDQSTAGESLRALALVHAGQAAAQVGRWQRSLELLDKCLHDFPNGRWADEARYERGWALYHLERWDEARREFEAVAASDGEVLGVRAEFMIGEILFAKKQHDEAVRTFFKVAYGHGDRDAPEPYRRWQAEALFEAARCLEETRRPGAASQLYQELIDCYPASERAASARDALEQIGPR